MVVDGIVRLHSKSENTVGGVLLRVEKLLPVSGLDLVNHVELHIVEA